MPPDDVAPPAAAPAVTPPASAGGAGAPDGVERRAEQTVPFDRFQTVTGKLNAAETRAATLEAELATARAQAGTAAAFQQQAAAASARYDSHFGIARTLGNFEPTVIEAVEFRYDRLPEAERAAGLETVLAGWKADPSKAPPDVRPHFETKTPAAPGRAPVDPHKGVVPTSPSAGGEKTPQEMYAMSPAERLQWSNAQRAARGLPLHPTKS